MERLHGADLAEHLRCHGPLPVAHALTLIIQACEALAEVHAAGLVHGDIKPSNLFLVRGTNGRECLKLVDVGFSRAHLTSGGFTGSPGYASPEQLGTRPSIDARADVWGLGAVLFELISGRRAFGGHDLPATLLSSVALGPSVLTSPFGAVSHLVDDIVRTCLASEREARFQSVAQLAASLQDALHVTTRRTAFARPVAPRHDTHSDTLNAYTMPSDQPLVVAQVQSSRKWLGYMVAPIAAALVFGVMQLGGGDAARPVAASVNCACSSR